MHVMRTLALIGALSVATVTLTVLTGPAYADSKTQGSEFQENRVIDPGAPTERDLARLANEMELSRAADGDCLLPANIKGKGHKCDSVGDFGLGTAYPLYSLSPFQAERRHEASQTYQAYLRRSVDTEVTFIGLFKRYGKIAPYIVSPEGESIYLIGANDVFSEGELIQVTGELKFKPAVRSDSDSVSSSPAYYYFDCSKAAVSPFKPKK
jgi:hypothetical protein